MTAGVPAITAAIPRYYTFLYMGRRPGGFRGEVHVGKTIRRTFVTVAAALVLCASLSGAQTEERAVRAAIQQYFKGHATASAEEMRKAFLPTAHIEGIRSGVFTSWTVEQYVAGFRGTPAADENTRKRTIDSVDIQGTAAMARATLVHGATTFTDYFVLLKSGGEWKIANKVYSSAPTAR